MCFDARSCIALGNMTLIVFEAYNKHIGNWPPDMFCKFPDPAAKWVQEEKLG